MTFPCMVRRTEMIMCQGCGVARPLSGTAGQLRMYATRNCKNCPSNQPRKPPRVEVVPCPACGAERHLKGNRARIEEARSRPCVSCAAKKTAAQKSARAERARLIPCVRCGVERRIVGSTREFRIAADRVCHRCAAENARGFVVRTPKTRQPRRHSIATEQDMEVDWVVVDRLVAGKPTEANWAEVRDATLRLLRRGMTLNGAALHLGRSSKSLSKLVNVDEEDAA